jgi:amino acid adenylation domain-containing protein
MTVAIAASADASWSDGESGYGLSPMQSGMLFQYVLGGGAHAGYDVEQLHIAAKETFDPALMERAWTHVARRHPVLSTAFRWEDVTEPLQTPQRDVTVPVEVEDWSDAGDEERRRRRDAFLLRDRRRGFDLSRAPLMRVTLIRTGHDHSELVWTFHHILLDGRSFAPVLREAFAAYAALRSGRAWDLPPPPRPYRDYIRSLRRLDTRDGLIHFAKLLEGKTAPTPLPCAEPAARPLPREGYGQVAAHMDRPLVQAAHEAVGRTGTTMGTLVQAAWSLVLSRLTGEDDVLFGSTRSGRHSVLEGQAESMVGLFINTLPVRARVGGRLTVRELLASLRAQTIETRAHEQIPLVDIQGVCRIPRGTPLFETLLMFENRELNRVLRESGDPGWAARTVTLHEQPSPPLTITVVDDETIEIHVLYDRSRFRDAVAERIAAYLRTAIESLAGDEHRFLGEIEILPEPERRRLLLDWNATEREFPDQVCIHHPFEDWALRQPDAVALEMEGASIRFGELDTLANRIAHALLAHGAGPGKYVGVCMQRSPDLVATLLGVAKSGAAYVPLDPTHPTERLTGMLDDAKATLVVTEDAHRSRFGRDTLVLDSDELAGMPGTRPPQTAASTDPCYAIFTSGSTGKPKGVVLSHRAVMNTVDWVSRTFHVGPGDRLLFVTSPCFDLSVYDTFGALGAGATVVVASSRQLADPEALAAAVVSERITIWDSAPAALQRLTPFFPPEAKDAPLRLVMLSGDWIPIALPDKMRETFGRARVVSLGGATEAAIWSNWFPVGELDPRWTSIPYGLPIQNARYHVLDRRRKLVPIGVTGDLYIGGVCLAEGYLNRPELTAERFVEDPFRPGERLYATGDLARRFDDGNLEFLGRADFQVKIRGFRVELGEVETVLAEAPGVREAVCTAHADASGQRSLVAYVLPRDGAAVVEEAVKAYAASKLPDYMVPSQVMALDRWPLSSNGKLDRQALPSPGGRSNSAAFVEPRNDIERELAAIWRDLLGRESFSVTDNFFALGGHSLLAVMLVTRIQRRLGVRVPLARLLEAPTIACLAAALESSKESRSGHTLAMNTLGKRPPLVLVSGVGGFGLIFRGIARDLGSDQPLYALNAIGSEDDDERADHTIEEIATIYESEILAACPSGPVVLGGYSFGILVAFEIAHRLKAQGRPVPLLCSFDGFAPGYPKLTPMPARMTAHVRAIATRPGAQRVAYLRQRFLNLRGRILTAIGRPEEAFEAPATADPETAKRLRRVAAGLWAARDAYRPTQRLDCDLLLVKTSVLTRWDGTECDDPFYGWRSFIDGEIRIDTVEGEHLKMFDGPIDTEIAQLVAREIDRLKR